MVNKYCSSQQKYTLKGCYYPTEVPVGNWLGYTGPGYQDRYRLNWKVEKLRFIEWIVKGLIFLTNKQKVQLSPISLHWLVLNNGKWTTSIQLSVLNAAVKVWRRNMPGNPYVVQVVVDRGITAGLTNSPTQGLGPGLTLKSYSWYIGLAITSPHSFLILTPIQQLAHIVTVIVTHCHLIHWQQYLPHVSVQEAILYILYDRSTFFIWSKSANEIQSNNFTHFKEFKYSCSTKFMIVCLKIKYLKLLITQ